MGQEIKGPLCAPGLWFGGGIRFMLQATNSIREPQIGRRRCWPRAQDIVECRLSLPGRCRREKVEVVSYGAVRWVGGANGEDAFEDFCANKIFIALVALGLRHVAYPAEVKLPRFPVKAILSSQALADRRT